MMKISGCSNKYPNECSLHEFIQQSEKYQTLDNDRLNQVYRFLMCNSAQGIMATHPFPIERLHYLRSWAVSEKYQEIRQGHY